MQTPRPSTWLLACVFATCCGRQGTQCLPVGRPAVPQVVFAPNGKPGVLFPVVDPANMPPNPLLEDDEQSIRFRVLRDNENTGYSHQLTPAAVRRLEQLLFGLADDIPRAGGRYRSGANAGAAREGRQTPIYREGRTGERPPPPEARPLRRESDTPIAAESIGRTDAIWSPTRARADVGVRLPARRPAEQQIAPGYQPERDISAMAAEQRARMAQERKRLKSHRPGTEEFPIQTPAHSRKADYGETKRVENARGWNNLRGMWGKRSLPPVERPPASRWARSDDASESAAEAAAAATDAPDAAPDEDEQPAESDRPQPLRSM